MTIQDHIGEAQALVEKAREHVGHALATIAVLTHPDEADRLEELESDMGEVIHNLNSFCFEAA